MQKFLQRLALALLCALGICHARTPCPDTFDLSVNLRPPGSEVWLGPNDNPVEATLPFKWTITAGNSTLTVRLRRIDWMLMEMELSEDFDGDTKVLKAQSSIPHATERTYVHLAQDTATGNLWALTLKPSCPKRWI